MKKTNIKLGKEYVLSIRKTTEQEIRLINTKGEEKVIYLNKYINNDDVIGYEAESSLLNKKGEEVEIEEIENFMGEDFDITELDDILYG